MVVLATSMTCATMSAVELRELTVDDLPAAWELARIAFGAEREPPPGWLSDRPGRVNCGIF